MAGGRRSGARGGAKAPRERLEIAFFGHQAVEYLAALFVLQAGAQTGGNAAVPCYVIGGLILAAAAFSGKPLGGGHRVSRQAHRFIDIAIIISLGAAPFVFDFADEGSAGFRLLLLAVIMAVLSWVTNYSRPQPGMARDIARGITHNASRSAGRAVARRLTKRPPGGPPRA